MEFNQSPQQQRLCLVPLEHAASNQPCYHLLLCLFLTKSGFWKGIFFIPPYFHNKFLEAWKKWPRIQQFGLSVSKAHGKSRRASAIIHLRWAGLNAPKSTKIQKHIVTSYKQKHRLETDEGISRNQAATTAAAPLPPPCPHGAPWVH